MYNRSLLIFVVLSQSAATYLLLSVFMPSPPFIMPVAVAYTSERLQQARDLFPPKSKSDAPSAELIRQAQGPRYNLRPRDSKKSVERHPAWIDNDDSDKNYTPPNDSRESSPKSDH